MGIALIIILPISAVTAATLRSTLSPSYWFQIHRALGVSVPLILILYIFSLLRVGHLQCGRTSGYQESELSGWGSMRHLAVGAVLDQVSSQAVDGLYAQTAEF
jgi:hypothetical protein